MAQQQTATLYLRGVPRDLVREAKVTAARRGITLTALVKEALASTLERSLSLAEDLPEDFRRDWAWYERNKSKLLKRYRNQYVAIINRKVVDHDTESHTLAQRVFDRYGVRSIPMPKVIAKERVVHIYSPRLNP